MAAPMVSGVAALLLYVNPSLTVDEVRQALYASATDLGAAGKDDETGWGLVNAANAVASVATVVSISLNSSAKTLAPGGTHTLVAAVTSNLPDTDLTVAWSSDNPTVATVSNTGLVKGIKVGTATITATSNYDSSVTATCTVYVGPSVTGVTLSSTARAVALDSKTTLAATVAPSNAANRTVTWTSSNPAVATVSSTGVVSGVSLGTATITVKTQDGGKTATCVVTVGPAVTGVTLNTTVRTVPVGATYTLVPTISPSNAANKTVKWTSSNTAIATVSSTGVVKGIAAGTATITCTTLNGSKTATCTVTVT